MAFLVYLLLFLAMSGHSSATYCLCKDGVGEQALQKAIDYACGAGADCTQIQQNGPCFQPNTVKDHCNYAVNSYFQKKGQAQGSCDFSGAATPSSNPPSSVPSGCSFPSSGSPGTGTTTPGTGTPTPGTGTPTPGTGTPTPGTGTPTPGTGTTPTTSPGTGTTPTTSPGTGTTTPGTATPGTTTPSTTIPGTTTPGSTTTPGTSPNVFGGAGLGPTGSGMGIPDSSGGAEDLLRCSNSNLIFTFAAFTISSLLLLMLGC